MKFFHKRLGLFMQHVPLQVVLIVPFVIQIVLAVSLTGWLSIQNGQEAIENIATQLRQEVGERISSELDRYLSHPPTVNQIHADAIQLGMLDRKNFYLMGNFFARQMQLHQVGYINYANEAREFLGVERLESGEIRINETTVRLGTSKQSVYATDERGDRGPLLGIETIPKDVRQEGWYAAAAKAGKPVWSSVYSWDDKPEILSISHSYPLYDGAGKLEGVLGVDYILTQISQFLRSLKVGKSGMTLIVERTGMTIASSSAESPVMVENGRGRRLNILESKIPRLRETAKFLTHQFGGLQNIQGSSQWRFPLDGQLQFVQVKNWQDKYGLDWLIIIVVPEVDFTEKIQLNTTVTILLCAIAFLVASAVGLVTSQWLVRPIAKMVKATSSLSKGDWQQQVSEFGTRELSLLARAFNEMSRQLHDSFIHLEHVAYHDLLTGLPNRLSFLKSLEAAIGRTKQNSHYLFAVLLLDLDGFKLVNDSLGHLTGDRLLVSVSHRLRESLAKKGTIARFGGDEFMILLEPIANAERAIEVAEGIARALKQPFTIDAHEVFIRTSIGIVLSRFGERPETFLRDADTALYRAKASGKSCYAIFDTDMHSQVVKRLHLETDLRHGLQRQEFEVYYQPIVSLRDRRICGLEALVRWHHGKEGIISPELFIPIAEETGFIGELGEWVLEQACEQMKQWDKIPSCRHMSLSVNVSSQQFLQADLSERIENILAITGLEHQRLKLEITETVIMAHAELTSGNLNRFNELGICLTIDDFGIGYSSLSYLHRLPVSTLKIDRSFITSLDDGQGNHVLVEAIVLMARKLGMGVVAEGVETVQQLRFLKDLGCQEAQGFYLSPPLPALAMEQLLYDGKILF